MSETAIAEAPAEIGHNNPPAEDPLIARLTEQNGDLMSKADQFGEACERCPDPVDKASAQKVTDFIKQIGQLVKALNSARTEAKAPYLDAGRKVDGFFNARKDALETALAPIKQKLNAYVAEEDHKRRAAEEEARRAELEAARNAEPASPSFEATTPAPAPAKTQVRGEYGAVASARTVWEFEIEDASKIPVSVLRKYLTADAIEKAMRAAVRDGVRDVKGVRIFETTKAQVR